MKNLKINGNHKIILVNGKKNETKLETKIFPFVDF